MGVVWLLHPGPAGCPDLIQHSITLEKPPNSLIKNREMILFVKFLTYDQILGQNITFFPRDRNSETYI